MWNGTRIVFDLKMFDFLAPRLSHRIPTMFFYVAHECGVLLVLSIFKDLGQAINSFVLPFLTLTVVRQRG